MGTDVSDGVEPTIHVEHADGAVVHVDYEGFAVRYLAYVSHKALQMDLPSDPRWDSESVEFGCVVVEDAPT